MPSEVDLTVATLTYLGYDMEVVQFDLCTTLAQEDSLPPAVGRVLGCGILGRELPLGHGLLERCQPRLARREVGQQIKVVIVKDWDKRARRIVVSDLRVEPTQ